MSATSTPASSSNNVKEEKPDPTLAEVVRKLNTERLIDFLKEQEDLQLDEDDFKILRDEKITGRAFLKLTEEKLQRYGMKGGPAIVLADFAKEVKEKKLRSYSSYRTLKDFKEILAKYGIVSGDITRIPQFTPGENYILGFYIIQYSVMLTLRIW